MSLWLFALALHALDPASAVTFNTRSPSSIARVMRAATPAYRRCRALDRDAPDQLDLRFWIAPAGEVREVRVEGASNHPLARRCVHGVTASLAFERSPSPTAVRFPMTL